MTRRSKRDIERALDSLDGSGAFGLRDYLWADLKDYHGGDLSAGERALLAHPERLLSARAHRRMQHRGDSQ